MTIAPTYGREALQPGAPTVPSRSLAVGHFGVEGLDDMIPQGLTYDSQTMVLGDTGVGKSVLAAQFLYEGLVTGDVCVYVACDEPPDNMRQHMAGFRLGTAAYERSGQLIMVDAYARELSKERRTVAEPNNLDEFFLHSRRAVEEALAKGSRARLVTDSLSTVLATNTPLDILGFNGHRLRYLRSRQVLTLDAFVQGVLDEQTMAGLSHVYPLILKMRYNMVNGAMVRYIQLGKLKSGQFSASEHQFSIDPRTGIVVHQQRGEMR